MDEGFRRRCAQGVHACEQGRAKLQDVVDRLQREALDAGLVDSIGQDHVQWIMATEFMRKGGSP